MVLIHELGHYTAAKILGFTVEEFAVGFGPKLFSRRRKNGELFSLRMLPLGGFCSFLGETEQDGDNTAPNVQNAEQADTAQTAADTSAPSEVPPAPDAASMPTTGESTPAPDVGTPDAPPVRLDKNGKPALTFYEQKPWKRIIVLLGGVVFNFLSAIIFSFIFCWAIGYSVPCVGEVYTDVDGAPYCALQKGDIILGVNGDDISIMNSYADLTQKYAKRKSFTFKVQRGGEIIDVIAERKQIATVDEDGKPYAYEGFGFASSYSYRGKTAGNAFKYCVPFTFKMSWSIIGSFGDLFTGKTPITSLSGPVGSIKLMADVTALDPRNILILLPLLASNLAIFNLIPFPALDGASVVFTVIEWIRRKPLNRKVQGLINAIGLAVLLVFVLTVDILSCAL